MPHKRTGLALLASVAAALTACGDGPPIQPAGGAAGTSAVAAACGPESFCAGAAKVRMTPTQSHIDGVSEPRLGGYEVKQHFHLGGFGFGPFELARDAANSPIGQALGFSERTCDPAGGTCVSNPEATRRLHCQGFMDCGDEDSLAEHTWVRAFYVSQPESESERGTEVVFLALDAIGAGNLVIDGIKDAVIAAVPTLKRENILVGMTHTHAGADLQGLWGGVPQDWVINTLRVAAAEAVKSAHDQAMRAILTYATGRDGAFNSYRRPRYHEDTADADPNLSVLQATAGNGAVLATMVQYAAHPTAIGPDSGKEFGRVPHPDYPLGLSDRIEAVTGAPAIYFNGPIADASGSGETTGEDDYARVRSRGECLARSALTLLAPAHDQRCEFSELPANLPAPVQLAPGIVVKSATAQLPITNPLFLVVGGALQFGRYYDFQPFQLADIPGVGPQLATEQTNLPQVVMTASTLVNRITLGEDSRKLEIVTLPGEATNTFGQYIRRLAHDEAGTDHVMLLGLTQNSFGYILPEEEFNFVDPSGDAGFVAPFTGYEEFVSLGPLTAPLLRIQAYNPLFGIAPDDTRNLPPVLTSCEAPASSDCIIGNLLARLDYIQRSYANLCRENDGPEEFCALLDPETPLAEPCRSNGLPEDLCDLFGDAGRKVIDNSGNAGDPETAGLRGAPSRVKAGAAVVDMTPDVGYCAGQYCSGLDDTAELFNLLNPAGSGGKDPFLTAKLKRKSYGVQSRLTARAIVVEGANFKRIALVKTDNYLAQDALIRRVAQLLEHGSSGIGYDQILHHVTHSHSAAYSSTPAWGVPLFEDAFDPRFFEIQARRIAQAIEQAAGNMRPARMGATTVRHTLYKGNVVRPQVADDGTPAGYPLEYGDHGLVVMRLDEVDAQGEFVGPIAVWMNWGEHPESLDGYDLHSADFIAPLERFVDRELGAPLVYSQGDVGSAENTGNESQLLDDGGAVCGEWPADAEVPASDACPAGQGVLRDWNHEGYVQTERNVRFLADAVIQGFHEIETLTANDPVGHKIAFTSDFPVDFVNAWVPGPLSHPYPSVSNCRTEPTVQGSPGVPVLGLPDCERPFGAPAESPLAPAFAPLAMIYATMKAEGVPVPDHYDFTGFSAVEENARLKLQAFRVGEVLLASCACEAQVDLILNLESRTDHATGNIFDGFDWACVDPRFQQDPVCERQRNYYDPAEFPTIVPGSLDDADRIARMRAQVHNDAAGWDAPENVLDAGSEPVSIEEIHGNFTKDEIQAWLPLGKQGYILPVGIGHAGDYNGYTVSYREYMNRDSYRKALTSYGPHTADYMVTRLVRMAAQMKGGAARDDEPHSALALLDELRQTVLTAALGTVTAAAYDAWQAALPMDSGPAEALAQPENITHFSAATFHWRGGNTQVDNPRVHVEREVHGEWEPFADQTGEVQTMVTWPGDLPGVVTAYAGQFAWEWTANFEAYQAFPARLGSTPAGTYRFVVEGCINDGLSDAPDSLQQNGEGRVASLARALLPDTTSGYIGAAIDSQPCPGASRIYQLASDSFTVSAWTGGEVPRSYPSQFPFVEDNENPRICDRCSFRPWVGH